MTDDLDISLRQRGDASVRLRRDLDTVRLRRAAVLVGGKRMTVPPEGLLIGRDSQCDLRLVSGLVAPRHARVETLGREARITDLGSNLGTYVNGEHFVKSSRAIRSGDSIAIGDEVLYFVTAENSPLPPIEVPLPQSQLRMDRAQLTLGRDPSNDVVLDHPTVSPVHAEIISGASGARIKDLSHGGSGVRVNGQLISRSFLRTGSEIAIGPFRLVFDGALLQQRSIEDGLRLDAEGVRVDIGDKTILHPASLTLLPGELVAIVGPSGAGKSTLLTALCGVRSVTAGRVTVEGEAVQARATDIGYVPQDEIVHPLLSVREAVQYAAELRLPQDTSREDRLAAVERVLEEVGLTPHADTRIANLSGGQRKRVGVATELISQPGLLFLDEPTTGLDPGLEQRLMVLFRRLSEAGRATLLVTHATRSLRLCDKIVVMGEGGHLCFAGAPDDALSFFGVEHHDELYTALEEEGAEIWGTRFRERIDARREVMIPPQPKRRVQPRRPITPQAFTLIRRRTNVLLRDRRNLLILGIQVPIIGLLVAVLFSHDVFIHAAGIRMSAGLSAQLLFLLVTVALWFGSLASAREIVSERAVAQRELAVGVRVPAYLLSKGVVLCTLTGVQTGLMAVVVLSLRPVYESPPTTGLLILILVLTAWVGVSMGLVVSVLARSEDQAVSFIPLLLIPQLLFGGSVMPVHQMGPLLKVGSKVISSQWAFAGMGSAIHMNTRISEDAVFRNVSRYGHSFFALPAATVILVLIAFMAAAVVMVGVRLQRFVGGRAPI